MKINSFYFFAYLFGQVMCGQGEHFLPSSTEVGKILLACYRGNKGRGEGKFHCRRRLFEEEEGEKTGSFSF